MLDAVETTAAWTTGRIIAVRDLFEQTCDRCRRELPSKVYSKELIELTFVQPYCKIAFVVDAGIAQSQTAARYLQALEEIGVLSSTKIGREKYYINPGLIDVLSV
jgi:Fic family protein